MNEAKIKACVESYERHLDGAVKMGEIPASTDIKYLTDLLAEILKVQAGGSQPALSVTAETKHVRISDLLACPFCGEPDYDLVGLKSHITKGECEVFTKVETIRSPFDAYCPGRANNQAHRSA